MFVTESGSLLTTILWIQALTGKGEAPARFIGVIAFWLWFPVIFANFSEALAEGRGKAQAESSKIAPGYACKFTNHRSDFFSGRSPRENTGGALRPAQRRSLPGGIRGYPPADGEMTAGIASVDEGAITGESAPVVREAGGDRGCDRGTRLLSDWLIVSVTTDPGEGFLDQMISLVEGAKRQKTPNEIALSVLLSSFTIVFLVVCITLLPFSIYSVEAAGKGSPLTATVLIALLICLIPTTIGGLLSAIGIAGMDRLIQRNVIAMSAGRLKPLVMWTFSCWIKPGRSPWGTAKLWISSPLKV